MSADAIVSESELLAAATSVNALRQALNNVLFGQEELVEMTLCGVFARGHVLLEGLPGLGKTELVKGLAKALNLTTRRVQFTPDLLPGDITGNPVLQEVDGRREFVFQPGPIFTNLLLADEINRTSPKTQSALLEAMQERRVTVLGESHEPPAPFFVPATQNPIELEGTYRLPEAQLDRFLMRIEMGPPDLATEVDILKTHAERNPLDALRPVMNAQDVAGMAAAATGVHVSGGILEYAARIAQATRSTPEFRIGVSPRGTLALIRAARVRAAMEGREFVAPDDVRMLAPAVLNHRLILSPEAELQGRRADQVLEAVVDAIPVPQRRVDA